MPVTGFPDYFVKEGDRKPFVEAEFRDETGAVIDLTSASSITFVMRQYWETDPVALVGTATGDANGIATFEWGNGDTDVPGFFLACWILDFGGGDSFRLPVDGYQRVSVVKNLDD